MKTSQWMNGQDVELDAFILLWINPHISSKIRQQQRESFHISTFDAKLQEKFNFDGRFQDWLVDYNENIRQLGNKLSSLKICKFLSNFSLQVPWIVSHSAAVWQSANFDIPLLIIRFARCIVGPSLIGVSKNSQRTVGSQSESTIYNNSNSRFAFRNCMLLMVYRTTVSFRTLICTKASS